MLCLVFRSFIGTTFFTGVLNSTSSKVKALTPSEHSNGKSHANKIKAKAAVAVNANGKFEMEHVEITFNSEADRQEFISSFNEALKSKKE